MPNRLIGNPGSINSVADWVEFYISATMDSLSKAELSSYIEESSGSEPDQSFLDDVWLELERRLLLYGDMKPYNLAPREAVPLIEWKEIPEYITCIILSLDGNSVESVKTGKLFERLSSKAVQKYLDSSAIIFGFPQQQTVKDIAEKMHETFIREPSSNFKDRGVDIICWKTFNDARKSQLTALIQCAAGFNWGDKLLDIPYKAWTQYIHWGSDPIKGFTVPVIITHNKFDDNVTDAGLMFDRPRIYQNIQYSFDNDASLIDDLIAWCQIRVDSFIKIG